MPLSLRTVRCFCVLLGLPGLLLSMLLLPAGAAHAQGAPMSFTLIDVEGKQLHWTTAGPRAGTLPSVEVLGGGFVSRQRVRFSSGQRVSAAVQSANGQVTYYLTGNGGTLAWKQSTTNASARDTPDQNVPPAPNLPRLSWATGLAWDEARGVLAIVSTGSDAQFYRFDTRARRWLDARAIHSSDITSLAFNAATGRFAAVTDRADLLLLDARGTLEEVRPLDGVLAQLAEARHPETRSFDGLQVFADGDRFALVNVLRGRVTHVWTYDWTTRQASLTYKPGGLTVAKSSPPSAPTAPPVAAPVTLPARKSADNLAEADPVARETAAGEALFATRCQSAGARRLYPVGAVNGVRLDNLRGEVASTAHADRDWPDAGIPGDVGGKAYVHAFLDMEINNRHTSPGWSIGIDMSRVTLKGYDFVDVRQADGSYLRHRLAANGKLVTEPIPTSKAARYAVSYQPHGHADDRKHWVAGALVRVTDTRSGLVLGELEAYAHKPPPRQGSDDPSRRSWHGARTCPAYNDVPGLMVRMFAEQVLQRPR